MAYVPPHKRSAAARSLIALTRDGDVDGMTAALAAGGNANERDGRGTTPLMWASQPGTPAATSVQAIALLLAHGADASLRAENGDTAAAYAASHNQPEALRALAAGPAGVAAICLAGRNGVNALHTATWFGYARCIAVYAELRAEALNRGDAASAEALLAAINARQEGEPEGPTPLIEAARSVHRTGRGAYDALLSAGARAEDTWVNSAGGRETAAEVIERKAVAGKDGNRTTLTSSGRTFIDARGGVYHMSSGGNRVYH